MKQIMERLDVKGGKFRNFEIELKLRGYSKETIKAYLFFNNKFLEFTRKGIREIRKLDIRSYLIHLIEFYGAKPRTVNLAHSALKCYYDSFRKRRLFRDIRRSKIEKDLPTAPTKEEIEVMIDVTDNPKHKVLIELLFGSGLRVGEAVKLRVNDVYPERKLAKIIRGKGKKDRFVIVSTRFIFDMMKYLRLRKQNSEYLFNSKHSHITKRTAEKIVENAANKAKLRYHVHPHSLRASFATELLNNGTRMCMISKLMGHERLETTKGYARLKTTSIENIASPLDT